MESYCIRHRDGRYGTLSRDGIPEWTENPEEALGFTLKKHADFFAGGDPDVVVIPRTVAEGDGMPDFNTWFGSLAEGRQAVLRDDKWMLARASFDAARSSPAYPTFADWYDSLNPGLRAGMQDDPMLVAEMAFAAGALRAA